MLLHRRDDLSRLGSHVRLELHLLLLLLCLVLHQLLLLGLHHLIVAARFHLAGVVPYLVEALWLSKIGLVGSWLLLGLRLL